MIMRLQADRFLEMQRDHNRLHSCTGGGYSQPTSDGPRASEGDADEYHFGGLSWMWIVPTRYSGAWMIG